MKDRSYKVLRVLRIVSIALGIFLSLFYFAKRVGLCEGGNGYDTSNNNIVGGYPVDFPLPYGESAFVDYGKDSGIDLSPVVNTLLSWNSDITLITVGFADESNPSVRCFHGWYQGYYSGSITSRVFSPDFPQLNINGGRFDVYFDTSTGTILNGPPSGTYTECSSLRIGDYVLPIVLESGQTEYYRISRDIWIPGYPVYSWGNQNIYCNNEFLFLYDNDTLGSISSGVGLVGDITGSIGGEFLVNPITDENGNVIYDSNGNPIGYTGTTTSNDIELSIDLDTSGIDEKLDTIAGNQEAIKESMESGINAIAGKAEAISGKMDSIGQKLDSIGQSLKDPQDNKTWFEKIFLKLKEIYDYITEPFNEAKFNQKLSSLQVTQDINSVKASINSVTSSFDVSTASGDSLKFTIPFDLPYINFHYDAVIDFTWYENIRNIVVPFMVSFLCFGMVWSLIRSIPGIFHGNSPDGDS